MMCLKDCTKKSVSYTSYIWVKVNHRNMRYMSLFETYPKDTIQVHLTLWLVRRKKNERENKISKFKLDEKWKEKKNKIFVS